MGIIAHRGYWKSQEEKNSLPAFERAFRDGFGVETDIRDYGGELVISHNIAGADSIPCDALFELYRSCGNDALLALNVKADGIQGLLKTKLEKYKIQNYFVFDMSVPEMVVYRSEKIKFLTRRSDIENECVLYNDAAGVWNDAFFGDMGKAVDSVESDLRCGKWSVIVSPELHGRERNGVWDAIKRTGIYRQEGFWLCTDYPDEAWQVFGRGGQEDEA